jgi:integrase
MVAGVHKSVRAKLTKRTVDATPIPATAEARVWDTELKGYCLRIYPKSRKSSEGRKVYAVKYRVDGIQRWYTVGEHGNPWTPDLAREEAKTVLGDAAVGKDHQAAKLERRADLTTNEVIDAYLVEGPIARPAKRPSSWAQDRSSLTRHVRPLLGKKVARTLKKADLARMVKDITDGATTADVKTVFRGRAIVRGGSGAAIRTLSTVKAMLNWAIAQGLLTDNPAKGIELPRRPVKERFLSDVESIRLFETLLAMEADKSLNATHADVFRMLALTGARRTEIAGLRWSEVDLNRGRLVLPPSRTKAGEKTGDRRIALGSAARLILEVRRGSNETFVFPAHRGGGHIVGLQKIWERVRTRAGLPGVRIHDLRHSYASFAIADGASLFMVAKALGHADTRVTERYSHIQGDALSDLAERAERRMSGESANSTRSQE